jgi:capsule polysaccharide modification protein KpsS
VRGKEQGWVSFVKEQKKDLLPEGWSPLKHNIAIFNTSEDEYESIGPEWKNYLYPTQAEGIKKILESFIADDKYHFYLRIHPNLKGLYNKQLTDAYALKQYNNLTIIDADSPVSTYTLMMTCGKTITFGSSTGIEATYWGKPSILLGKSFYYNLDVAFKPNNHEETIALIATDLKHKNKSDTLKYGYYFKTFGNKFRYYQPSGFLSGEFKGQDLDKESTLRTKIYEYFYNIRAIKYLYDLRKRFRLLLFV